jgi:hypothetical protein
MKVGFLCESPSNQKAMAIFAEGLLGAPPEPIGMSLEAHGVTGVFRILDGVFRGVHYNSDADALVIVVDSDDSELHEIGHENTENASEKCRLCQARRVIRRAQTQLKPRPSGAPLKVAIGLAVPAIEAWYLVGKEHQVGEAAWRVGLTEGRVPFTRRQLKQIVYGTDHPSVERETQCALTEARRIIGNVNAIELAFPAGFGLMANEIRSWLTKPNTVNPTVR